MRRKWSKQLFKLADIFRVSHVVFAAKSIIQAAVSASADPLQVVLYSVQYFKVIKIVTSNTVKSHLKFQMRDTRTARERNLSVGGTNDFKTVHISTIQTHR